MEKTSSVEERIRRAEEIYQKRKSKNVRMSSNTVNIGNSPDFSLFKKTLIKIFCCTILYFLLYFIKNSNYFFSNDVIKKTNEILSYDMNLQEIYNNASKHLGDLYYNFQNFRNENQEKNNEEIKKDEDDNNSDSGENNSLEVKENNSNLELNDDNNTKINENSNKQEEIIQNIDKGIENNIKKNEENNQNEVSSEQNQANLGIGGTDETINKNEEQVNQMDIDAKYIKENFKIEIPLKGVITSRFGLRTPTNIISANHAGIDIGASGGSKIKCAMTGKVTLVSNVGDYRKSYRNKK